MNLFDTHVHFCRLDGDYTQEKQVERAREAGLTRMVAVGGSCELNKGAVDDLPAPGQVRGYLDAIFIVSAVEIIPEVEIDSAIGDEGKVLV